MKPVEYARLDSQGHSVLGIGGPPIRKRLQQNRSVFGVQAIRLVHHRQRLFGRGDAFGIARVLTSRADTNPVGAGTPKCEEMDGVSGRRAVGLDRSLEQGETLRIIALQVREKRGRQQHVGIIGVVLLNERQGAGAVVSENLPIPIVAELHRRDSDNWVARGCCLERNVRPRTRGPLQTRLIAQRLDRENDQDDEEDDDPRSSDRAHGTFPLTY